MRFVKLTKGMEAVVDDEDFDRVSQHSWCYDSGYAHTRIKTKKVYMHRFILGTRSGEQIDHANRNRTDNRKSNLRIGSQSQNMGNSGKRAGGHPYKGVHKHHTGKWKAEITINYKNKHLGVFDCPIEAAAAYNKAAIAQWGEFACINQIP